MVSTVMYSPVQLARLLRDDAVIRAYLGEPEAETA